MSLIQLLINKTGQNQQCDIYRSYEDLHSGLKTFPEVQDGEHVTALSVDYRTEYLMSSQPILINTILLLVNPHCAPLRGYGK